MQHEVIYVEGWDDPRIAAIRGDCMLHVADGVHFHARLGLLIVVKGDLAPGRGVHLPKRPPRE